MVEKLNEQIETVDSIGTVEPLPKRAKRSEFADNCEESNNSVDLNKELELYLSDTVSDDYEDAAQYWSKNTERFRHLAVVAFDVFSIPCSTAEVERLFSKLKFLVNKNQYNFKPDTVSQRLRGMFSKRAI